MGLDVDLLNRYPHQLSGGQRQRVSIARALAARPDCIVADEPVAALDASQQMKVADLLARQAKDHGAALLFISHDLGIVERIADQVAVMYLGQVVEYGAVADVMANPKHPYTRSLLASRPSVDRVGVLPEAPKGDVPKPSDPPSGCTFHPRCPYVMDHCKRVTPQLKEEGDGVSVSCWLYDDLHSPHEQSPHQL
jgi:peptide/nickel transport system ATP-binding protein